MSRAISQQNNSINSKKYPGTRQICDMCGEPTGRCEEDGYFDNNENVYCEHCFNSGLRIRQEEVKGNE